MLPLLQRAFLQGIAIHLGDSDGIAGANASSCPLVRELAAILRLQRDVCAVGSVNVRCFRGELATELFVARLSCENGVLTWRTT